MTWRLVPLASLLSILACSERGTPAADPGAVTSGSRLQARQWTAPGMAPLTVAIFDRERHQECQFRRATDGKLRCLPVSDDLGETSDCADPACQQPLYLRRGIVPCDGVAGDYVTVPRVPSSCPGEVTYEVRRLMPVPAGARRYNPGGSDAGPAEAGSLMAVETVAPASWVEGQESVEAGTARLSVRWVASTDGGRFAVGLHDSRWGRPCTLVGDVTGELRCWPASASLERALFSDPSCKVPVASPSYAGCEVPAVVSADSGLFSVGPRWSGKVYVFGGHGPCVEVANPSPTYQAGAPLAPDALAVLASTAEGTGRVRGKLLRDDSGRTFPPPLDALLALSSPFVDGAQGADCRPIQTRSAGLRCLDASGCDGWPLPLFADAGCTRRLASCAAAARPIVSYRPWPSCHATAADTVLPVAGEARGTIYYATTEGCDALPLQTDRRLVLGAPLGEGEEASFWAGFPRLDEGVAPAGAH